VRTRSETIGSLGRSPARQSKGPENAPPPLRGPEEPPAPERGLVARWLRGAFLDNTGLKFLSLVLAVTVFLLINTDKDREITVRVGVKYDLPADKVLVSEQLEEVKVTIKGAWRRLRQFDERELGRIELDLRSSPTGDIAITPDMIGNLPPGLEVLSISACSRPWSRSRPSRSASKAAPMPSSSSPSSSSPKGSVSTRLRELPSRSGSSRSWSPRKCRACRSRSAATAPTRRSGGSCPRRSRSR
jgi:hypothetical protein